MIAKRQQLARDKARYNNPAYARLSLLLGCGIQVRGEGAYSYDEYGRRLLSMFDQYGNQSFGYSHPAIVKAIAEKLASGNVNSTKILLEEDQILLAKELAASTNHHLTCTYFSNGGGEAIENALKIARAVTRRPNFVTALGCFHGKTFGTLSASGRPEHAALLNPLMPSFIQIPYGDLGALERALSKDTAAVLLEPIQAEAGVWVPEYDYLSAARELCRKNGALLIFDEMQTGFGRVGSLFAYQWYDVTPDIFCVGKAFGGGILALSAIVARPELWELLERFPSTFGSSLGGNPLACAVGRVVLRMASNTAFLSGVRERADIITRRMEKWVSHYPQLVVAHRGVGMMHGLQFNDESIAGLFLEQLYSKGVTSTFSLYNNLVLRVQPPMTIGVEELITGLDRIEETIAEVQSHRRRWPSLARGESFVEVTRSFNSSASAILDILHKQPSILDPFAADPLRSRTEEEDEFVGLLSAGTLVWRDVLEWHDDGLLARSDGNWPWAMLCRRVIVTGGAVPTSHVTLRIDWDGGTHTYEPMIAGCIGLFVRGRINALMERFAILLSGSARTDAPIHSDNNVLS